MNNITDEILRQSQNVKPGVFSCSSCLHYKGALVCEKGIFIAFEGANLLHCPQFDGGKKCRHCGKIT